MVIATLLRHALHECAATCKDMMDDGADWPLWMSECENETWVGLDACTDFTLSVLCTFSVFCWFARVVCRAEQSASLIKQKEPFRIAILVQIVEHV